MAGRASYMMATRNTAAAEKAFQALVARYPETPNVHYAFAVFLLQEQPDKAIEEFKRELELQPGHASSLMQIAYEYVNRGDAQAALPWAKQAVAAAPNSFAARQGARTGAARHRRRRRRNQGARARHQARAGESRPALHARARLPARRAPGRCRARARRVHEAGSAGPHAAERRAVRGGKMTVLRSAVRRCRSQLCWRFMLGSAQQQRRTACAASARPEA